MFESTKLIKKFAAKIENKQQYLLAFVLLPAIFVQPQISGLSLSFSSDFIGFIDEVRVQRLTLHYIFICTHVNIRVDHKMLDMQIKR